MRQALNWLKRKLIRTKKYFDHDDNQRSNFGLGHFVLLLSLTPYIFSLSLYNLGNSEAIPSKYEIDPDRFTELNYDELQTGVIKPTLPKVNISKAQRTLILTYFTSSPENFCLRKQNSRFGIFFDGLYQVIYQNIKTNCASYKKLRKQYIKDKKVYDKVIRDINNNKEKRNKLALRFINTKNHIKPEAPTPDIIATSNNNVSYFVNQTIQFSSLESDSDSDSDKQDIVKGENAEGDVTKNDKSDNEEISSDSKPSILNTLKERTLNASPLQIINYPSWFICLLLIFPTLILCIKRKAWLILAIGLMVPSYNYVIYFSTLLTGSNVAGYLQLTSPIFAQLAFIIFLIRGNLNSNAFKTYILILSASTLFPTAFRLLISDNLTNAGFETYSILKAQLPIFIFILISCLGRLFIKGIKENSILLKGFNFKTNLVNFGRAFILWIPLFILSLPFFYLTESLIPKTAINQLHQSNTLQYDYTYKHGFLDNALQSAAYISDNLNFVWHLTIEEKKSYLQAKNKEFNKLDFADVIDKHYENIIPKRMEFQDSNSGAPFVGWLVDLVSDEVKKSVNRSFVKMRNGIKNNIIELANEKQREIKALGNNKTEEINTELTILKIQGKEKIRENNKAMQSAIWVSVNYFQAIHQLALMLFGFICVKSYLYVFARVNFHQNNGRNITLGEYDNKTINNEEDNQTRLLSISGIKPCGLEYTIESNEEQTYFVSRLYQCRGKPPKLRIPQPLKSPLARLFNKSYTMNEITLQKGEPNVNCSATKGIEFFEWTLNDKETVIFDHHNFVAMTKSIQLSTLISPRISSLLLGGLIYSQATGPGKLVFMTKGRAEIANESNQKGSLPPERIVAMDKDTNLHVDSELDFLNVYLSSAYVNPVSGKMIIDVDSQHGTKTGLSSFIRNFIFPG